MKTFKQAERLPTDGPISVTRIGNGRLVISVTNANSEETVTVSEHNAARVFGLLALMLGIDLPARIGKEIKL